MAEGAEALAASVRDFVSGQQDGRAAELAAGTGRGLGEAAGLGAGRAGQGVRAWGRGAALRGPLSHVARGYGAAC